MRLDPHRLTLWLALIATGATYFVLSPSYRTAVPAKAEAPWIGLPDSGMDAREFPLRQLLDFQLMGRGHTDRWLNLARGCGSFVDTASAQFPERYIARFNESPWEAGWEVVMDVDKEMIDISVRSGDFLPPPLPRPVGAPEMISIRPTTHTRMQKVKAEPIRRAWNNPLLWHAPQKESFCVDGLTLALEACVHGQYAVRERKCADVGNQAAETLRTAFKTLLPAPEPIYERPAP